MEGVGSIPHPTPRRRFSSERSISLYIAGAHLRAGKCGYVSPGAACGLGVCRLRERRLCLRCLPVASIPSVEPHVS